MERGSPKSCFLFLGSVLCEVNWVSVLSDAWSPSPRPETRSMIVCLLFMMVLLAKEDQLVDESVSLESLSWRLGKASQILPFYKLWFFTCFLTPRSCDICLAYGMCLQLGAWFSGIVPNRILDYEGKHVELGYENQFYFTSHPLLVSSPTRSKSSFEKLGSEYLQIFMCFCQDFGYNFYKYFDLSRYFFDISPVPCWSRAILVVTP